ncbi:hypothetical protein PGT21_008335 [Puccinia graminis f. sp. tritici]|uniref:Uncharacterized protein n=1 Tax=Puccinia graminis f. sp. tritici TaxID=56615 RepID=A0A5B0MBI2_PUCGR|nr:hypothetical protein PGT21_008335 [Puccinia graminis f. sp. tritici]
MYGYLQVIIFPFQLLILALVIGIVISPNIKEFIDQGSRISPETNLGLSKKSGAEIQNYPEEYEVDRIQNSLIPQVRGFPTNEDLQANSPLKKKIKPVRLLSTKVDKDQAMCALEDIFGTQKGKEGEINMPHDRKANLLRHLEPNNMREFVVKAVSKDLWKKWTEKKLNTKLLYLMLYLMNIREPMENFVEVAPFVPLVIWSELRKLWRASKLQWESAETQIRTLFPDQFEAKRRLLSFRRLLHRATISLRWSQFRCQQKILGRIPPSELDDLEDAYGLSVECNFNADNVDKIPRRHWRWDTAVGSGGSWTVGSILESLCGRNEARRRQELNDYKMNRKGPDLHWLKRVLIERRADRYGVDVLTACKIADSLQLYCDFLIGDAFGRMTFDESFAQILEVFAEQGKDFPGPESPEQTWLQWVYKSEYKQRLIKLARSIEVSESENPLSTAAVRKLLRSNRSLKGSYGSGLQILLWCQLGLDLDEWVRIAQIKQSGDPEQINDLVISLSKISGVERKRLQWWHQAMNAYGTAEEAGLGIAPHAWLNLSQSFYPRIRVPWIILKQRAWRFLRNTFHQLKPWDCAYRQSGVVTRAESRSTRIGKIVTTVYSRGQ